MSWIAWLIFWPFMTIVDIYEGMVEAYCRSYGHDPDTRGVWCRRCDGPVN